MLLADAMRKIDERVVAGSTLEITTDPPFRVGPYSVPTTHTVTLWNVPVGGVVANPRCTAYSQEAAVQSIGSLLADWEERFGFS